MFTDGIIWVTHELTLCEKAELATKIDSNPDYAGIHDVLSATDGSVQLSRNTDLGVWSFC